MLFKMKAEKGKLSSKAEKQLPKTWEENQKKVVASRAKEEKLARKEGNQQGQTLQKNE